MLSIIILFFVFVYIVSRFKYSSNYSQYPPGPISLPIIGSILSLGRNPHENLSRLKAKYGNVIAIDVGSYRGIAVNNFDTIKQVLSRKEFQIRPATESTILIRGANLPGIAFSSGKTNEEQRAFVLKTLKNFGMGKRSIEHLLVQELQRLCASLDKKVGMTIENEDLFHLTAISSLWKIMTGEHGSVEDLEFVELMRTIRVAGRNFTIFPLFFTTICKLFPKVSGWNDFIWSMTSIQDYGCKSIQSHITDFNPDKEPQDLIESYLKKIEMTTDEKSSFYGKTGHENLNGVIADFLGAGTDTVANCLTWFTALAVYYPELQTKLQTQIDKVIGKNRLPSLEDRQQLPYIECFILEILRYSALTPLGIPHETSEDAKLDEYIIPKGTIVIPNLYDALHDPKMWVEPEKFNPERFLSSDGSAVERNIARNVDLVFGHGKRICPGEALAKDEVFLFITGLLQRYTFQKDETCFYSEKIPTEFGISIIPQPHSLVINKR